MNFFYKQIQDLFIEEEIEDFSDLPKSKESRRQFVSLFNEFNKYLEAARIQGYRFTSDDDQEKNQGINELDYLYVVKEEDEEYNLSEQSITEEAFGAIKQRYKELCNSTENKNNDAPYDIEGYITEMDPVKVNKDYMNIRQNCLLVA